MTNASAELLLGALRLLDTPDEGDLERVADALRAGPEDLAGELRAAGREGGVDAWRRLFGLLVVRKEHRLGFTLLDLATAFAIAEEEATL